MSENERKIPGKLEKPNSQYIYLVKIGNGNLAPRDNIFKIGKSANLKQRLRLLCQEFGATITLFAYGCSGSPREIEHSLHSHFWEFGYSFLKGENYPKWSNEYFHFENDVLCGVFTTFTQFCDDVVIFEKPRPKMVYSGNYEIINGKIIPLVQEDE